MRSLEELKKLGENGMEELADTMRSPDFGKLSYEQRLDCMAEYLCLKALKENPKLQEEKQERLHRDLKCTGAARRSLSRLLTKFTGEQCLNELNSEYYSDSIYGKRLMYDSTGYISGYTEAQLTGIYIKSRTKKNVNIEYDKALEKGDTSEFHKQWNEAKAQRQAEIEARERRNKEDEKRAEEERKIRLAEEEKLRQEKEKARLEREKEDARKQAELLEEFKRQKDRAEIEKHKKEEAENKKPEPEKEELAPKQEEPSASELRQEKRRSLISYHIDKITYEDELIEKAERELESFDSPDSNKSKADEEIKKLDDFKREKERVAAQHAKKTRELNELEAQICSMEKIVPNKDTKKLFKDYMLLLAQCSDTYRNMNSAEQELADEKITNKMKASDKTFEIITENCLTGSNAIMIMNTDYVKSTCFSGSVMPKVKNASPEAASEQSDEFFLQLKLANEWEADLGGNSFHTYSVQKRSAADIDLIGADAKKIEKKEAECTIKLAELGDSTKRYLKKKEEVNDLKLRMAEERYEREKELYTEGVPESMIKAEEEKYVDEKAKSIRKSQERERFLENTKLINEHRAQVKKNDMIAHPYDYPSTETIDEAIALDKSRVEPGVDSPQTLRAILLDLTALNIQKEASGGDAMFDKDVHTLNYTELSNDSTFGDMLSSMSEKKLLEAINDNAKFYEDYKKEKKAETELEPLNINAEIEKNAANLNIGEEKEKAVNAPAPDDGLPEALREEKKAEDELEPLNIGELQAEAEKNAVKQKKHTEAAPVDIMPEAPKEETVKNETVYDEIVSLKQGTATLNKEEAPDLDSLRSELEQTQAKPRSNSIKPSDHPDFEDFILNNENLDIGRESLKIEEERISNRLDDDTFINNRQSGKARQSIYKKSEPQTSPTAENKTEPIDIMPPKAVENNIIEKKVIGAKNVSELINRKSDDATLADKAVGIASDARLACKGVWFGSGKYSDALSAMDKLSAAMQAYTALDTDPNATLKEKKEALEKVTELNKQLKEKSELYFERKRGQGLLTNSGVMPENLSKKTAKRINAVKDAVELSSDIDKLISTRTKEYDRLNRSRDEIMNHKYPRTNVFETGNMTERDYLWDAYMEANKARSTIRSAVISGKTMDMTKKKACIAKIMVNEVMTNMKYREESLGFGIGALTNYLPEAAMDPKTIFYNKQIEMMIHDKVFINMVSKLNEDQLVEFVVNPSDLTRKYVTSPDKAKSLISVKEEIENAKASVSKKKTKDKTKDKSKDKTKSKTTDKTTSKTTGNKKGNEKTFKKK